MLLLLHVPAPPAPSYAQEDKKGEAPLEGVVGYLEAVAPAYAQL